MIELPPTATMRDFQRYVHDLEAMHGWLRHDLITNTFYMTEEVGELSRAIRNLLEHEEKSPDDGDGRAARVEELGEEIVDVLNYLLAIANRAGIDVEEAFRRKNRRNQSRTW